MAVSDVIRKASFRAGAGRNARDHSGNALPFTMERPPLCRDVAKPATELANPGV